MIGDNLKKVIIILGIIMSIYLIYNNQEELILIPNEAIRVRVIANSNSEYDQNVKETLKDKLKIKYDSLLKKSTSIVETRKILNENIEELTTFVDKNLQNLNYNKDFNINYGLNYFPEKNFKGVKYPSGYYESLVVTLGDGKGDNYWCVLYPPLCLIDESEKQEYEYRSYIKDILNKYI